MGETFSLARTAAASQEVFPISIFKYKFSVWLIIQKFLLFKLSNGIFIEPYSKNQLAQCLLDADLHGAIILGHGLSLNWYRINASGNL